MYRLFYTLILSRFPAEGTHRVIFAALRFVMALPGLQWLVRKACVPQDANLAVSALGMRFDSPVGLAAGFDKNAEGFAALGALGFGFVEIGTVTGEPQVGNPKPRMFRLPQDRALLNRMGFNNAGSAAAAKRLTRRDPNSSLIIGANIGKTKRVAPEDAIADYVRSAKRLTPVADYIAVNVSSPNTPGLRDLQAVSHLRPLLVAVRAAMQEVCPNRHVPLLVKIAPDLASEDIDAIADLALALKLDGIIATNTTIDRQGLQTDANTVQALGAGGISGAPLQHRSLNILRQLRGRVGPGMVLISVGGIENGEDAALRLRAGANLVQAYTGFVYGGPLWTRRINQHLAAVLRR